jgi:UDP-glucose 4-epimerase
LNAAVLRIFSAYGSGLKKQVIYDLCRKLHENANTNISLFGTGEESRDFIHADDIAAGIDHAITHELNGTYNLASGIETKISNLANRLRILCKSQAELIFTGESRAGDPLRWQADISKLTATGFRPETTLDVGLKQYHDWYCQLEHN